MDENIKRILLKNFWEYFELAELAYERKKYNGAVTLYYKALVELGDLALLDSVGRLGANHTERFQMLEQYQPQLYSIASKLFRFYRDSYNKEISAVIAKVVKENVEEAKYMVIK
ncbi:MAG: hypothetical protein ABH824_07710 [Nanoarchaeota archaeon]|nr:hypothetical protein [Nanoarchaeota archaeon]MBU1631633.1 hypothetical protein [Nanoarchaeota archaeon]MBU1875646.1 hypothetical protein [Nanoarchaeota archaeon]